MSLRTMPVASPVFLANATSPSGPIRGSVSFNSPAVNVLAAAWLGTVPSVLAGGTVTLVVALITAVLAPRLRALRLDVVPEIFTLPDK
jgi:hypothetical protein